MHCSGGSGRTGHILAAWLVYRNGISPKEAIRAIKSMGRDPQEAGDNNQLMQLLEYAMQLRTTKLI